MTVRFSDKLGHLVNNKPSRWRSFGRSAMVAPFGFAAGAIARRRRSVHDSSGSNSGSPVDSVGSNAQAIGVSMFRRAMGRGGQRVSNSSEANDLVSGGAGVFLTGAPPGRRRSVVSSSSVGSTCGVAADASTRAQGWASGWRRGRSKGRQRSSQRKKRPKYLIIEVTDTGVGMDQVCILML